MAISPGKCTQFAVKEQFKKTGKTDGFAVVGKAEPHHRWDVVKHATMATECLTKSMADAALVRLHSTAAGARA